MASAMPDLRTVTFPAAEHRRPLAGTKLSYSLEYNCGQIGRLSKM